MPDQCQSSEENNEGNKPSLITSGILPDQVQIGTNQINSHISFTVYTLPNSLINFFELVEDVGSESEDPNDIGDHSSSE